MKIHVIPAGQLSSTERASWIAIQNSDPLMASPYFCLEFTEAVAAVRADTCVAILEDRGAILGFFPFQRYRGGAGGPVGGRLSDYQAVIIGRDAEWNAEDLIRGCGLSIWDFDHLIVSQAPFEAYHRVVGHSPVMDLSGGFDAYLERRRRSGSQRIRQFMRKARKIERELGDVRFEPDVKDPDVLNWVIRWKSEQCRKTGGTDFFRFDWTVGLVRRIAATRTANFAGLVSVLYQGDRVIAAHMGMRSRSICHWWFPVYDHAFGKYSPGAILLLRLAEWGASQGISCIDLGKGDDPYKASFMTDAVPLAAGSVILPSLRGAFRRAREAAESFLRHSPLAAPVRAPIRAQRRIIRRLGARTKRASRT